MQAGEKKRPPHCAQVGLVLQGGGALGAYQAGVYATLAQSGYEPDWIAGVSIGAINGALIAGNPPERRAQRLRQFWELITDGISVKPLFDGDMIRGAFNEWSALASIASGVQGFFRPRVPAAWLQPRGTEAALSFYDTAPLR
jgi:NTE family protein